MGKPSNTIPVLVRPDSGFNNDNIEVRLKEYNGSSLKHWHDYYEIEFICGGNGTYYINGTQYPVIRGSAYFVTPVDFHSVEGNVKIYNVAFNDSLISEDVMQMLISYNTATVVNFGESEFSRIEKILDCLRHEFINDEIFRNHSMSALMDYLLTRYLRKLKTVDTDLCRSDMAVMRVASYIKFNFKSKITLAQAAQSVHLTPNYVGEIFRDKMGMSFNVYLMQTRLNYAKNLLIKGNCTVEEAAFGSGFCSQTYFSDCFKRQFGFTPTSLKKQTIHGREFI